MVNTLYTLFLLSHSKFVFLFHKKTFISYWYKGNFADNMLNLVKFLDQHYRSVVIIATSVRRFWHR